MLRINRVKLSNSISESVSKFCYIQLINMSSCTKSVPAKYRKICTLNFELEIYNVLKAYTLLKFLFTM